VDTPPGSRVIWSTTVTLVVALRPFAVAVSVPVPPTWPVGWNAPEPSTAPMSGRSKLHTPLSFVVAPVFVLPETENVVGGGTTPLFTTIVGFAGAIESDT